MPRQKDLRLERQILELRSRGISIRGIARELHRSPATVSRYARSDINRSLLDGLTGKLESAEGTLRLAYQALEAIANTVIFPGQPTMTHKQRLSEALKDWPGEYRRH